MGGQGLLGIVGDGCGWWRRTRHPALFALAHANMFGSSSWDQGTRRSATFVTSHSRPCSQVHLLRLLASDLSSSLASFDLLILATAHSIPNETIFTSLSAGPHVAPPWPTLRNISRIIF